MKKLAAVISIATLAVLPIVAHAHEDIFQTDIPTPVAPICLMSDCCDFNDDTARDFINGPFTSVCEFLYGPDNPPAILSKEKEFRE